MASIVAFASLPFGLRGGVYKVKTVYGKHEVHVSEQGFSPFLNVCSRPELMQSLPASGLGEGFTTYTWYDHPFVLRVAFGRNVAALGSISSCATLALPVPPEVDASDLTRVAPLRERFCDEALAVLNRLIYVVRRRARIYHVLDLSREDIDITVRDDHGYLLHDDPLQEDLIRQEEAESERLDLLHRDDDWYRTLEKEIVQHRPNDLASDLLIEAERALTHRFPRQAIATCCTAIEAASSWLLTRAMKRRDLPDYEIDELLATKSLTSKLDPLMRRHTGFGLKRANLKLWDSFGDLKDLRNDIVHRGRTPTMVDATQALATTRKVLSWLAMVRQRNRLS